MLEEGRGDEVATAESYDWHFAVGELNKAQLTALSAAERVMREKAEAEATAMKSKVPFLRILHAVGECPEALHAHCPPCCVLRSVLRCTGAFL